MPLAKLLISYIATLAVFLAIDFVWLGFLARGIYQKYLGNFLSDYMNWAAAGLFYLIFVAGVSALIIHPAVEKNSLLHATGMGALFGVVTYATYDLTNLATLKGWPWEIVVIDILWGAFLTAAVSSAGFYIVKWIA